MKRIVRFIVLLCMMGVLVGCFPYIIFVKRISDLQKPGRFSITFSKSDELDTKLMWGKKDGDCIYLASVGDDCEYYINMRDRVVTMNIPAVVSIIIGNETPVIVREVFSGLNEIFLSSEQITQITGKQFDTSFAWDLQPKSVFAWKKVESMPGEDKMQGYWFFGMEGQKVYCAVSKPWNGKGELVWRFSDQEKDIQCTLQFTPCEVDVNVPEVNIPENMFYGIRRILELLNKKSR